MKYKAWDKKLKIYREDVVVSPNGNVYIVRGDEELNSIVNNYYKKQGDILGGMYGEIDYSDWYGIENIEIIME